MVKNITLNLNKTSLIACVLCATSFIGKTNGQQLPQEVALGSKVPGAYLPKPAPNNNNNTQQQQQTRGVIYEPPPPVIIEGKKATTLTDDETKQFLEEKIFTLYQDVGDVELLRVAPGYALTVTFDTPIAAVIMGDTNLVSFSMHGTTLVLSAKQRFGDTSMQLIFGGQKIFNYHIFIAENFATAQSTIRVVSNAGASNGKQNQFIGEDDNLDLKALTEVISNYDTLVSEKALDSRSIKRVPVFKKSDLTGFEMYYIYVFKGGMTVFTFAYTNPFNDSVTYDESRLRIQIGGAQFVPDFVSIHKTNLKHGESTTGYAVLKHTPFAIDQPMEIVW